MSEVPYEPSLNEIRALVDALKEQSAGRKEKLHNCLKINRELSRNLADYEGWSDYWFEIVVELAARLGRLNKRLRIKDLKSNVKLYKERHYDRRHRS